MFRNKGFKVHLRVMAVPAIISRLSIFLRYETQLVEKGFARWTRIEDHDDRFNNLKTNLIEIKNNKKPDSIKFYERVLGKSGTIQLKCLEGFEIKNLGNIEVNSDNLYFVNQMAEKVRNLIQNRSGRSIDFEKITI